MNKGIIFGNNQYGDKCKKCSGSGKCDGYRCAACNGKGHRPKP